MDKSTHMVSIPYEDYLEYTRLVNKEIGETVPYDKILTDLARSVVVNPDLSNKAFSEILAEAVNKNGCKTITNTQGIRIELDDKIKISNDFPKEGIDKFIHDFNKSSLM